MKANKTIRLCYGMVCCLLLPACHQQESPKTRTSVLRLFDLFQPEDLTGKVTPENAGWKHFEWGVQDMAPWTPPPKPDTNNPQRAGTQTAPLGFSALNEHDEAK